VRTAGIAVAGASRGRPAIRVVVVDDAGGSPVIVQAEEITSADVTTVEQLFQAARAIESRITGLEVARVIVREAETQYPARTDGQRRRLKMEGAVVAAARAAVADTRLGAGSDFGQWRGTSKAAVDSDGDALVKAAGEHSKFVEAAAAALVGLVL
jgi:hypothetical protein